MNEGFPWKGAPHYADVVVLLEFRIGVALLIGAVLARHHAWCQSAIVPKCLARNILVRWRGIPVDFTGGIDRIRIRRRAAEDGRATRCRRPRGQRRAKPPAGHSWTSSASGSRIRREHDRQSDRNRRFPRPVRRLRRIAQARAKRSRCWIEARRLARVCQSQGKQRRRNSRLKQKYRANSCGA
jgi:hypothetical protein